MTQEEVHQEWNYRYQERLGILCGSGTPTPEQERLAREEANAWVNEITKPDELIL